MREPTMVRGAGENVGENLQTPLCNASKTAELNGLNSFTIRRLGASGKIKIYRCGAAVRYDPNEVRAYMAQQGEAQRTRPRARGKGKQN